MVIHYKKSRGLRMMISGGILTLLYLFLLAEGESNPWMLVPCILISISGWLYLRQPYFELRSNELVVYGLLGQEIKRYRFSDLSEFDVVRSRIYLDHEGKRTRVRVSRLVAGQQDWERFIDLILGNDLTRELHNI
jgi:hypothetical protein